MTTHPAETRIVRFPPVHHPIVACLAVICLLVGAYSASSASDSGQPPAEAVLVRIPFEARSDLLPIYDAGCRFHHISDGWALAKVPADRIASMPNGSNVIAGVLPGRAYGLAAGFPADVEGVDVLLRWKRLALVSVPEEDWELVHREARAHLVVPLGEYSREALLPSQAPIFTTPVEQRDAIVTTVLNRFDAARWRDTVVTLAHNQGAESRYAFRVRDVQILDGSPVPDDACDLAADWIGEELRALGYRVDEDLFRHVRFSSGFTKARDYGMRNLIATKPGSGPNRGRVILVTAHYDSIASRTEGWDENWRHMSAPGANDNATGVATVLEAARVLADVDLDFTVKFALFSGEELGLFGSRHLADLYRNSGEDLLGVLNTDMIGHEVDGDYDLHVMADARSEWMLAAIDGIESLTGGQIRVVPEANSDFVFSDHASFWAQGYSGLMFSEESDFESPEWSPEYHSVDDVTERLNLDYAIEAARVVIASAALLASPTQRGDSSAPQGDDAVRIIGATVFPNPYYAARPTPVRFQYQLNRTADVRLSIYDTSGRTVYDQQFAAASESGRYGLNAPVSWDGRDRNGERVSVGVYFAQIEATADDGSVDRRIVKLVVVPDDAWERHFRHQISPEP